jgi:alpha-galactosidase
MSMWSLMASPLIFSGDMNYLDEFTLNVLCNSEVIEVDQDPLGRQARIVRHTESDFVLAKPMEDGSLAVGVFNIGEKQARIQVTWAELGIQGQRRVRDLWRQKDIGQANGELSVEVNRHGVTMVRLFPR